MDTGALDRPARAALFCASLHNSGSVIPPACHIVVLRLSYGWIRSQPATPDLGVARVNHARAELLGRRGASQ
jgi:hypothetical protein